MAALTTADITSVTGLEFLIDTFGPISAAVEVTRATRELLGALSGLGAQINIKMLDMNHIAHA